MSTLNSERAARWAARKYRGLPCHDDLVQEARIGYWQAEQTFDESRDVKFSTHATNCMIGRIRHYLRDKAYLVCIPAWYQEAHGLPPIIISLDAMSMVAFDRVCPSQTISDDDLNFEMHLQHLEPVEREAIALTYRDGYSRARAARDAGVSSTTMQKRHRRAIDKLRALLAA